MVMAHCIDVGPCLIDAAMDHALAVERHAFGGQRLGVERELVDIRSLDQLRTAGAGEKITARIVRMSHADMAEAVEHAFMRDDSVGERQLIAGLVEGIGHGRSLFSAWWRGDCKWSRIIGTLRAQALPREASLVA
jgi:hypothetical protein